MYEFFIGIDFTMIVESEEASGSLCQGIDVKATEEEVVCEEAEGTFPICEGKEH